MMLKFMTGAPGMVCATAHSSRNSVLVSHRFFSTTISSVNAITPPKALRERALKDKNRSVGECGLLRRVSFITGFSWKSRDVAWAGREGAMGGAFSVFASLMKLR